VDEHGKLLDDKELEAGRVLNENKMKGEYGIPLL